MRKARQVLERLRPLLVAAQGQVPREEILLPPARRGPGSRGRTCHRAEPIPTAIPLASDIPNPTATEAAPDSGPDSSSTAAG